MKKLIQKIGDEDINLLNYMAEAFEETFLYDLRYFANHADDVNDSLVIESNFSDIVVRSTASGFVTRYNTYSDYVQETYQKFFPKNIMVIPFFKVKFFVEVLAKELK